MGREVHRERRHVPRPLMVVLSPFFRFSYTRAAYILRFGGERFGPVLVAPPPRR